jgi:hypothetical protein
MHINVSLHPDSNSKDFVISYDDINKKNTCFNYDDKHLFGNSFLALKIIKKDVDLFVQSPNDNTLNELYNKYSNLAPSYSSVFERIQFQSFLIEVLDINNEKIAEPFLDSLLNNKFLFDKIINEKSDSIKLLEKTNPNIINRLIKKPEFYNLIEKNDIKIKKDKSRSKLNY